MARPIVMISSYPPRLCGIGTFCEEAREFIQKAHPEREVLVISHTEGGGDGVFPLIDISDRRWMIPVVEKIRELDPYVVHIQHEYGLYEHCDDRGHGDANAGFLALLDMLNDYPTVVEPHTVHGRLRDAEAEFIYRMTKAANMVIFKCHYQKWRLDWNFTARGWDVPRNITIIPHGARDDYRWGLHEIPALRDELGLNGQVGLSKHLVGLVGWIQNNKRWDILTSMWEEIHEEIKERSGLEWDLLAAGAMRDPAHRPDYEKYVNSLDVLGSKGLAHFYEFIPRGELYYKVMAICDFVVLPSIDETQSGTLARIIALNKPYITTAPLEGLTAQTLESEGGLLFTNKQNLRDAVVRLACDETLRMQLGSNLKRYLDDVVSWQVVTQQYDETYDLARQGNGNGRPVELAVEF